MPIQNLWLPFGLAITVGALIIGMFYRERNHGYEYSDYTGSDFLPDAGYDTCQTKSQKPRKKDEEDERCIICYDSMKRHQNIRTLPCAHKFHKKCVNEWLRFENFCPMCRTSVV